MAQPAPALTPHQKTIVQLLIDGRYVKQAALEMGITEGAVRIHLFRARQRAGVESLYSLIAVAVSSGWCTPPEPRSQS
jgi:DNA-binding NarL/FixJ family response regulator